MQAENAKLAASLEQMSTEIELLKGRLEDATARLHQQDHALVQAQAQLDRKRQKKRAHKADADKFKQLWRTVRGYPCVVHAAFPCMLDSATFCHDCELTFGVCI